MTLGVVKQPLIDGGVLTAGQLGIIGSAFYFVYAVGKFLNGFIAYETNSLRDDLDLNTVQVERRYTMAMMLKEARYAILSRHWRTMICHSDKFEAKFKKEEQSTTHGSKTRDNG